VAVAVKTADTALMGENLLKLPESIHLASAPWP
jgi:cation transport ATPase